MQNIIGKNFFVVSRQINNYKNDYHNKIDCKK